MPRAITAVDTGPGFATYKLGRRESFRLLAVSFTVNDPGFAVTGVYPIFDVLDPTGGVIFRSQLGTFDYAPGQYSLATFAQGWKLDYFGNEGNPIYMGGDTYPVVAASLPPLTLTGSCLIRAYAWDFLTIYPQDPFTGLEPLLTVENLHLWVEDTGERRALPPPPSPLLTHVA